MSSSTSFTLVIGILCASIVSEAVSFILEGTSTSYAQFRKWNAGLNGTLEFEFKTDQGSGLLLYTDDGGTYDFFEIKLVESALRLRYNLGGGAQIVTVGKDLGDGHWHKVQVTRNNENTTLTVDGISLTSMSRGKEFEFGKLIGNSDVYVGGMPSWYNSKLTLLALPSVIFEPRFSGIIRNLVYADGDTISSRRQEMKSRDSKDGTSASPYPGGREVVGQAFRLEGVPEEAIPVILASLSTGTLKQYDKPMQLWWNLCEKKECSIFNPSISKILHFLTDQLKQVNSYGTLNSYRLAISLVVSGDIGNSPEIKRFFKGVASLKSQKPKYDYIWDPGRVLTYLSSLWLHDGITLQNLTKKLVTSLARVTAQRVRMLSKIQLKNIKSSEEQIQVLITDKIKTSGINRYQPILNTPYFRKHPELCTALTLKNYLKATENIRPKNENYLILTYKEPYHAASPQSISKWIKEVLNQSGTDTSIFTACSTRHASTSAAYRNGINVEVIRKAAGWSEESEVFARFYNRPLRDIPNFASAVINSI